jgi:2-succinyl-5-enolpyruvyl-6-hydroxy-3-cyclohexene-1-carboxylate synthase
VAEDRADSNAFWRSSVCRAVAASVGDGQAPAGPVHVNLPFHEPTVPVTDDGRSRAAGPVAAALDGRADRGPWVRTTVAPRRLEDEELRGLAGRLLATERGLIVAGATTPLARTAEAAGAVHDLARATGWPVLAEPTSGLRTDPSTVIAHAPLLAGHPELTRALTPDLVLRIGRTGLSREVAGLLRPKVPQLLLGADGSWDDPERAVGERLVADVHATVAALAVQLGLPATSDYGQRWRDLDTRAAAAIDAVLDRDGQPSEPRTARDLLAGLAPGTTLVVASSMPIRDLDRFARPRADVRVVANRGASGIDGFASTVLGVALGSAGPVVALTGDLSLLHDANGFLLSADAARVDAVFVVVDNDGGGIFSFLPQAGFPGSFERVFGTPHGRELADLARFHHLAYHPVVAAEELVPAVTSASEVGGLHLVHVRTERAANLALHRELTAAVHAAITPPH